MHSEMGETMLKNIDGKMGKLMTSINMTYEMGEIMDMGMHMVGGMGKIMDHMIGNMGKIMIHMIGNSGVLMMHM
eukprot:3321808-Heterocapsa_arctica.AAC.1